VRSIATLAALRFHGKFGRQHQPLQNRANDHWMLFQHRRLIFSESDGCPPSRILNNSKKMNKLSGGDGEQVNVLPLDGRGVGTTCKPPRPEMSAPRSKVRFTARTGEVESIQRLRMDAEPIVQESRPRSTCAHDVRRGGVLLKSACSSFGVYTFFVQQNQRLAILSPIPCLRGVQ